MTSPPPAGAASRPGREGDEILGLRPKLVFSPSTVEEASALLAATSRDALRIAFVGGGTEIDLGGRPEALDAVVRTERLARIVEHAPSDQIVVCEAGVRLADLQAALSVHRQRLAIDPPWPDRATIGGIVAANAFGPLRARYGSIRDLIIGVSLVRADGNPARGGGKVVKNVAGFDLPKLMVGSLGTLGLITSATFRLHPVPENSRTVLLRRLSASQIRALVREIRSAQLEPTSVLALSGGGPMDVGVVFEGFEAGVTQQVDRFVSLAARVDASGCEALDAPSAAGFRARHEALRTSGTFRAKIAAPPSALEKIGAEALSPLAAALEKPGLVWYATLGLGFITGIPISAERAADTVASARRVLGAVGGSLVLESAASDLRALCDAWGARPSSWPLLTAVKDRLDPERRLAPGRFVGGI